MLERLPIIRRLLAVAPLCALAACATDSASKADMDALRVELRAVREQQARTSERLERLERSTSVHRGPARPRLPPLLPRRPGPRRPPRPRRLTAKRRRARR